MEILNVVKNIIFDLGGVLLNIDPRKTIEAFGQLGMEQLIGDKGLSYDHDIFYLMEQGKITPDEFRNGVRKLLPTEVSDEQIDNAYSAIPMLFMSQNIMPTSGTSTDLKFHHFSKRIFIPTKSDSVNLRRNHFRKSSDCLALILKNQFLLMTLRPMWKQQLPAD